MKIYDIDFGIGLFLAPLSGYTNWPLRVLCRRYGAELAYTEMISSTGLLRREKSSMRILERPPEDRPLIAQIFSSNPQESALAARFLQHEGFDGIDINMGCPAKKVCNRWAGSALMQDEELALNIVAAVVAACAPQGVPVTLKMRTGWCATQRNALRIARGAEQRGIAMVVVHGRTREQGYKGQAEYDTIAAVKAALRIPVVANGDIDTPQKARDVLRATGADGVMIGRAAQGRPWLFREIDHFLRTGVHLAAPDVLQVKAWLLEHLNDHYGLYGELAGTRSARKHIGWTVRELPGGEGFRSRLNLLDDCAEQVRAVSDWFDELALEHRTLPQTAAANDAWLEQAA